MRTGEVFSRFRTASGLEVTLRSLRPDDTARLTRYINTLVKERDYNPDLGVISDRRMSRKKEAEFLAKMLKGIRRDQVVSVAAVVGDRVVGNSSIQRRQLTDESHTGLLGIAILDGYRGLGIGERMLRTLMERARRLGLKLIELEVIGDNEPALSLYRKLGFKTAGKIPHKILRRGRFKDVFVMYADIPGPQSSGPP